MERLCAGDGSVVEEIARGHLRLVLRVAARYKRFSCYDDLVSAGIERMLECIPRFAEARRGRTEPDHGITPYIVSNVRSGITNYIENDSVVRVPGRTLRAQGKDKPEFAVAPLHDFSDLGKKCFKPTNTMALDECLEMSCKDDLDVKIVKLRSAGHNDAEISKLTGYPQTAIYRARAAIEQRFNQLWRT